VETQFQKIPKDGSAAQPGDFVVTRHSNLPNFHVVFHLIVDIKSTDGNAQRTALMAGLQSILRLADRFDVVSLSIPLLLLPGLSPIGFPPVPNFVSNPPFFLFPLDPVSPISTDMSGCSKRGENVLKAIKGFLLENIRSSKASVVAQRTIQFTLPERTTPEQFQSFRNLLSSVYRVT